MLYLVLYLTLTVYFVSAVCDQRCLQQYTRVKRGKFYSNPPIKFYNLPPFPIPVNGPYSNTPPPFMVDYEPQYPGSRPYKVSKRPVGITTHNNDGLGDDNITNLVKYLSKQDLDKLLEFAQEKDQGFNKYKDIYKTNEYNRPFKRENKIIYKENVRMNYEDPQIKIVNYVTEPTYSKVYPIQENRKPIWPSSESRPIENKPFNNENFAQNQRVPIEDENFVQKYINDQIPDSFLGSNNKPAYHNIYSEGEPPGPPTQVKTENVPLYDSKETNTFSNNPYFTESNEEDKLLPPYNMREDDFVASNTNNVAKVVMADSYDIKNFGDLPLMDYEQFQLNDLSSYHVPHYTVTQSRPSKPAAPPPSALLPSYSSAAAYPPPSALLKPSPASASIKAPVYEPAPPISAAAEQSDAHLKAVKIWTHKSKGAAYTLHDDGTLSPERSRPKYG